MWDERYNIDVYAYGTEPNDFLKANIDAIPKGRVLSLAEGEGRNAVFLAKHGYSVTAVDSSSVGLNKAEKLAKEHGVQIELVQSDLAEYKITENEWDGVISIFCPLPAPGRKIVHKQVLEGLKQNGVFLLEAYTPEQLNYGTGGGNSIEPMQSVNSLSAELKGLNFTHLLERERKVIEGIYHTGLAKVVQAIGVKT